MSLFGIVEKRCLYSTTWAGSERIKFGDRNAFLESAGNLPAGKQDHLEPETVVGAGAMVNEAPFGLHLVQTGMTCE